LSNDTYLILSYFIFGMGSLVLAGFVYLVLRKPFGVLAEGTGHKNNSQFLKRHLPVFLALVAGAAFFSVSYYDTGCSVLTYEQVVKDRGYLVKTNRRQVRASADWMAGGVTLWSVVALFCVFMSRKADMTTKNNPS